MTTPTHEEALRVALEALDNAAEVMDWLADHDPDCFGWEAPFPSSQPTIRVEADRARTASTLIRKVLG